MLLMLRLRGTPRGPRERRGRPGGCPAPAPGGYAAGVVNKGEPSVSTLSVDDRGLTFAASGDFPVDVHFGDKRIFSFWTERDSTATRGGRHFPWPGVLHRFLDGAVQVRVVDPVSGRELAHSAARLGTGEGEVRVVNAQGEPMGLDKSMRLIGLFVDQGEQARDLLLDSMDTVIKVLRDAGADPFIAYGTLLGAVRQGDFIGHDSDADLGYVSRFDHPVDVVRESFELQRKVRKMGYAVFRYSGLGFKISVRGADGSSRGLDVFGGFMRDGELFLMGEVGTPFRREWIDPLSEVSLAGRSYPAPAVPERLLEAMYGPSWKVPDPAYQFTTPRSTSRRLNGWFRGVRTGLDARWLANSQGRNQQVLTGRSPFAAWVHEQAPEATVVDLGAGRGRDAVFYARQGHEVVGLDYFEPDLRRGRNRAKEAGVSIDFIWCNFGDARNTMVETAALVRRPGPRVLVGHHLLDSMASRAQSNLFRLARTTAREDGALYLQHYVRGTDHSRSKDLRPVRPRRWREALAASGGQVVARELITEHQAGVPDADPAAEPTIERVTLTWTK